MQRILVTCLGLLTACAAAQPAAAPAPRARAAPIARAERVHLGAPKPSAPVPFALDLDQKEAQEDAWLRKAISLYEDFIVRAGSDPSYAEAVQRSRERIADMEAILRFRDEGRRERARTNRPSHLDDGNEGAE